MTPKRPYPDGYPSEHERQEKAEGGRFPSQIKKLPHLGGVSADAHHPLASRWGIDTAGIRLHCPHGTWWTGLPPPPLGETTACRPMWTRWMALCRSTPELTTTTLATESSPPAPGEKFSRKRLEKEKAPQGRLFDSFALPLGERR